MSGKEIFIVMSEKQINGLINGETITMKSGDDMSVHIRQSLQKDMSEPIMVREKEVVSSKRLKNLGSSLGSNIISEMRRQAYGGKII